MNRPYRVGEIVLMDHHGWLKAFRVVQANRIQDDGETETIEYQLAMVEMENGPQWKRPKRD